MAQLGSSVVQGSLRVTDTTYTTDLIISGSKTARYALIAPTSAGAPTWRALTNADVGLGNVTNDAQVKASLGTAKGDMLYWSASATPARLAIGTAGYTLQATANGPAWTQTVAVANGGTGTTSFTANSLIMSGSTTTAALTTRAIVDRTSVNALTALTTWTANTGIPTVNLIAHWDGRYQTTNNSSNLAYCNKGAFGNMAIKTKGNGFSDSSNTISVAYGTDANTAVEGNQTIFTLNGSDKNSGSSASFYAPTVRAEAEGDAVANYTLISNSTGIPVWTDKLPIASGGTGTSGQADHQILIGTGTSLEWRVLDGSDLTTAIQYQADAPASADVVPGTIWLRPTSVSIEDLKCLVVQLNNISGDGTQPVTARYNSSSINQHMVVVGYSISNPAAVVGDLTWNTSDADPTLTVQGYINGNTNIILYLLPERGE